MLRKLCRFVLSIAIFFAFNIQTIDSFPRSLDQEKVQEEVTVTLKLIQVYVTDKKGNQVTDLTVEDFELEDNGKSKVITEFERHVLSLPSEVEKILEAEPVPHEEKIMPRKFFLFFDFAFNDLTGISMAKQAALHFINTQVHPTDEVGVITYSTLKGLVLHEYLTNNHKQVQDLLKDMGYKEILGRAGRMLEEQQMKLFKGGEWADPPDGPALEIRIKQDREMREGFMNIGGKMEFRLQARHFSSTIKDLAKALRYIPGIKHIILFSTGVPNWLMYRTSVESSPQLNKVNIAGSDTADLRRRYEDMTRELSVANSPVYTVNVQGIRADFMEAEGRSLISRYILDKDQPYAGIEPRNLLGETSLRNLAKDSGGKYFGNDNSPYQIVEEIQSLTGSYYVLGYPISEKWDGKYHRVKVKVKRKGCQVYSQRGYYNPKPFEDYSDLEKKVHLMDLALSEKPHFGVPVRFPLVAIPNEIARRTMVLMYFKTSAEALRDVIGEQMEIVFLVLDDRQNVVGYKGMAVGNSNIFEEDFVPYAVLPLYSGKFQCRVVLRNMETGRGAVASSSLFIPKAIEKKLKLFPPILLVPEGNARYLNAGLKEEKETEKEYSDLVNIFGFDPAEYSPCARDVSVKNPKLLFLTRFAVSAIPEAAVKLSARLIHQPTGEKVPLDFVFTERDEVFVLEIPTAELLVGPYFLYIFAEEVNSQSKSSVVTTFELK